MIEPHDVNGMTAYMAADDRHSIMTADMASWHHDTRTWHHDSARHEPLQLFKLACTFKLTVSILFYFKTFDKKTACACNVPAAHLPRSIGTRHSYKRFIYSYKRIFIYMHIFIYSCFEFICVYERFIYSYISI